MASPNAYVSGIGASTGHELTTIEPLYTSGVVYYVHSSTGSDSYAGTDRQKPFASLAAAVSAASAGDTIVVLSGHSQTWSAVQTLSKAGMTIVGEGSGSSRPQFTRFYAGSTFVGFDITAAGVTLANLYLQDSGTTAIPEAKIRSAAVNTVIDGCYIEQGPYDTGPAIEFVTGASQARIKDTTIVSVATSVAAQPESAIKVTNAVTDLELQDVTINGGTTGWSQPYAVNGAAAVTRLRVRNLVLTGDSDMTLATGTSGYVHVLTTGGSNRVSWAA